MDNSEPPPRPAPGYLLAVAAAGSTGAALLFVLHVSGHITLDAPALALFGFAVLVWLLPLVKRFKWGDTEVELWQAINKVEDKVDEVADDLSDSGAVASPSLAASEIATAEQLPPGQRTLLQAILHPRYPLRSLDGIAKSLGRDPKQARDELVVELEALKRKGLVKVYTKRSGGGLLYGLTPKAKALLEIG